MKPWHAAAAAAAIPAMIIIDALIPAVLEPCINSSAGLAFGPLICCPSLVLQLLQGRYILAFSLVFFGQASLTIEASTITKLIPKGSLS